MPKSTIGSSRTHQVAGSDHHSGSNQTPPQVVNPYDHLRIDDEFSTADAPAGKLAAEPLQWSRIFITMASLFIAAYLLTSGVAQFVSVELGIMLCGVTFASNDPNPKVTWLVASCVVTGSLRFLVSICVGRPAFNRRIWPSPSRHRTYVEQLIAVSKVPDIRPRSRDMSVLDREHLVAGIIHPAFYYRTLLIAWQEGLISIIWLAMHILRLVQLFKTFPEKHITELTRRDELLEELFASAGSNFTSIPLELFTVIVGKQNMLETVGLLRNPDTLNRLSSHTCEIMAMTAATLFYYEDLGFLCVLAIVLLLLPMLSRMLKFYRH